MERCAVIMAGGIGTRFWPLSRTNLPKQLLNISGNDVMLNETINRLRSIVDFKNIYVVTSKNQSDIIKQYITKDFHPENILYEPIGRNTTACIAYAAMRINAKNKEAIMAVLPSDHYIRDEDGFKETLAKGYEVAEKSNKLIAIGIKPTFPSTGYGYIRFDKECSTGFDKIHEVLEFVEKPDIKRARDYISDGSHLWNSGMFVWKTGTILENLKRFMPRFYKHLESVYSYIGTEKEQEMIDLIYPQLTNISIDYSVIERSDELLVVEGDFGWNDVGGWDSIGAVIPADADGNIIKGKHVGIDTKNSIVYGQKRLITTIGLENIIIADTEDALMICCRDKAQQVKTLVDILKNKGFEEHL